MAPYSDIDLLFLIPYKMTPRSEQVIEAILYLLWDLGLKVGQASRSIDDCIRQAKADMTIRTGLLEMRFLWGDQELYLELRRRFQREVQKRSATKFIAAKLAERDVRHQRQGGSRYSLEPHIKDGKGGLRDLHSLFWIAKYLYRVDDIRELAARGVFSRREVGQFLKAQNFLWTLRCHLHLLTGRAEERLTFDLQEKIAPLMGYTAHAGTRAVERFMKHYFLIAKDVGDLTRILCAVIEGERKGRSRFRLNPLARRKVAGFRLEGDRLSVAKAEVFAERPVEMLRIFKVAQDQGLDIHPEALRAIRRNLKRIDKALRADLEANRVFLEILTSDKDPETALRRMNEAGVFGRFIPDFGRVVAQIQYNMYHHYTVDEHTIFAIGQLHKIEAIGEDVVNDPDGTRLKARYAALSRALTRKKISGKGVTRHEIREPWTRPNDFLTGIYRGSSHYYTNFTGENIAVRLEIRASRRGVSNYVLIYQHKRAPRGNELLPEKDFL